MDLSVIIVSYNTADLIGPCLHSLEAACSCETEVIVVDNASSDGSAAFVKDNFPHIQLIANSANRGFAAANNQGLLRCQGRYVFFLNPDTVAMPGALDTAISFMDENPQVGLAGLRIINPDGTGQESVSYRYPGEKYTNGEVKGLNGPVACVLGAAMIARKERLEAVRGFDEDFFLYGEDQDLCLRIRKTGYEIAYINAAIIMHLGGQSERTTRAAEVWRKKTQAEYLFYRKHYHPGTIPRIARRDLWKARFRIAVLKATVNLPGNREERVRKLEKYEALSDEIRRTNVQSGPAKRGACGDAHS